MEKQLKASCVLSLGLIVLCLWPGQPAAQQKGSAQTPLKRAESSQPVPPGQAEKAGASQPQAPAATQGARPEPTASELIEQGKQHYRTLRLKQALARFEAALKLEPDHDEALGLAAETAYRLDNQMQAREWFLQRAELPNQKESVKAYNYYRTALTFWRQAHDLIGKHGEIKQGKVVFELPEQEAAIAQEYVTGGLDYIGRTLALRPSFAEAHNIKNLLHTEASFMAADEKKAADERRLGLASLRQAIELYKGGFGKEPAGNFGAPTIRVAEFAATRDEELKLDDPMKRAIEGGQPFTRVAALFPSVRPPRNTKDPKDPSATGVTAQGGAYSLGPGRGALTAAYLPGTVKVEVLVSASGKVIFAHVVDGRSDLNGAALLAAQGWVFAPAKFEGHPVQVSGIITFNMRPSARPAASPTPTSKPPQKPN
jgi:tetratricopeptide (TPR) repeat protein